MGLINRISDSELKAIEAYINAYGAKNEDKTMQITVPYALRFWEKNKESYLSQFFGDNLIISKHLNFEKSSEEIESEMRRKVIDSYYSDTAKECEIFYDAWRELTLTIGRSEDWEKYESWDHRQYTPIYWAMQDLVSASCLASNRYSGEPVEIPLPNDKIYRLSPNAKTSKAIGKIALAYNVKGYERFRILHSQVLNEKSISGEVCLSIHPLDYITMSENDCGWSSCMSWSDHGDYRQGTVEMMNSPCVVVAYLKSATDFIIPGGYTWNSKRWRQLFIVTPETLVAIKGYPYWNETLEVAVLDWIKELVDPTGEVYEPKVSYFERNGIIGNNDIRLYFSTNLMYNDIYSRHAIYLPKDHKILPKEINYSGESECLCCGEDMSYNYSTESDLFCNCCDETYQCCECGDYHSLEDLIEVDGEYYCEYCYESVTQTCADCGSVHHYDNFYTVHVAKDENHVYQHLYFEVCSECYEYGSRLFDSNKIKTVRTSLWGRESYILLEDITPEGLDCLDYDEEDPYDGPVFTTYDGNAISF